MRIEVKKLTGEDLMREACSFTSGKPSKISLKTIYDSEHSPMRTQLFWVAMFDIPTFVSVHLVRHQVGVTHFVKSNREDRGGDKEADRNTPVNHAMLLNAQSLVNMARKRLCGKASKETQFVMRRIRDAVAVVDPALSWFLVPECEYRKGCHEIKTCGRWKG